MPVPGRAWGGADRLLGVWQISHEMQSGIFILRAASVGQETGMQTECGTWSCECWGLRLCSQWGMRVGLACIAFMTLIWCTR